MSVFVLIWEDVMVRVFADIEAARAAAAQMGIFDPDIRHCEVE